MPSGFLLTLDRQTSLALELEAGPEPNTIVIKLAADADVVDAKLWGAIDITDPGTNGNYSETQGGAGWFPFASELTVRVAPGDGQKVFHVQVRDDVWNESSIETVKFGIAPEEEVGPPSGGVPGRTPAKPRRKRSPDRSRTIERRIQVAVKTHADLDRDFRLTIEQPSRIGVATTFAVARRRFIVGRASATSVGSRANLTVTQLPLAVATGVISDFEISKRRGRADDEAILALLL